MKATVIIIFCLSLLLSSLFILGGCRDKKKDHHDEREAIAVASLGIGSWRPTSTGDGCPQKREYHTAIWTGNKMIIWGGESVIIQGVRAINILLNTGSIYDPATDTWATISNGSNCPSPRSGHTAVWTGEKMIIWGGREDGGTDQNTGGVYDPETDTWTATSTDAPCPSPRIDHTAVWTGSTMIIWGGLDQNSSGFNTGGIYDPNTDTWMETSTSGECPLPRFYHTAVWTGEKMIVLGGILGVLNTGGIYNPAGDNWSSTSTGPGSPSIMAAHTAVWTGSEVIVWGGGTSIQASNIYNPENDEWKEIWSPRIYEDGIAGHSAIWAGKEMILWGGITYPGWILTNQGDLYNPETNSWTPTNIGLNCPSARAFHTAVWTGESIIIWGGEDKDWFTNTGGVFTP